MRCDTAVAACSPERKILSLQTAGLWYSTWRLTAPHTVSAFDDGAFVPAAGFCYFTTHTDCDCVPRSRARPPLPLPSQENCQMWSFCKVRLANSHHREDCVYVGSIHVWRRRIPVCSLSPHPQRLLLSECGGGASPSSHRSSSYLQKAALLVSQWVGGGFAQQPVMPQLPISCLSPTRPSSREALFYQRHSLKHLSATPNLSAFRNPLCPSLFLPPSQNPPLFLHCLCVIPPF